MIITKTPFRLSFFGGGTDHKSWYEKNGGLIIGTTFGAYCYLTVRRLPPFFDHHSRIVYSVIEGVKNNSDIKHHGVRSCLEYMDIGDGLEIHHDGDLPARSGIGSSSSFTVGFLKALHAYRGQMVSKKDLAEQAIYVEHEVEKQFGGVQDQIFASYGGFNVIRLGPGSSYTVNPVPFCEDYKKYLESHILLGFSGISRFSTTAAEAHSKNIKNGSIESQLSSIHGIAEEALGLFSQKSDIAKIGKLLHESWLLKRSFSEKVSTSYLDDLCDQAMKSGAYGCKVMGAGGGGFMFFLAPPEKHQQIMSDLKGINVWVPFRFESEGSSVIFYGGQDNRPFSGAKSQLNFSTNNS